MEGTEHKDTIQTLHGYLHLEFNEVLFIKKLGILTPGWPSLPDSERLSVDDPRTKLPTIPSIPISAEDATTIMKSLGGPVAPADWHGALDLPAYRLGGGPSILNLHYKIGSTEWVEQNYDLLFSSAVAYLNVDEAVKGPGFKPQSTPQLDDFIQDIAKEVEDPNNPGKTIYESWASSSQDSRPPIKRLGGGGSDYAPFVQHAGIPGTDFTFGEDFPANHSLYDDYMWMAKYGDPHFHRHVALGAMWGLTALKLADAKVLPFNYTTYADNLQLYVDTLESHLSSVDAPCFVSTNPLHKSIAELRKAALQINKKAQELEALEDESAELRSLNDHLVMAERAFTDADGLPGSPWYKHLVYGPSKINKYGTTAFPGISDLLALVAGDEANHSGDGWAGVQHQIWRVSRAISRVALVIHGELS